MRYYLYKAVTVPFKMILAYLSMLSIRDKKLFVFGSWDGNKFADNPKYLYLQTLKNPDLRAVWVTRSENVYKQLRDLNLPVHKQLSIRGIYYQLRAGVCVVCSHPGDVFIYLLGNAVQINLWHGVSLKKVVFDDLISGMMAGGSLKAFLFNVRTAIFNIPFRKEYVAATSEAMATIYLSAFRKDKSKILNLGQPRNDVFFDDSLEIERFRLKEKFDRIVLYMPTHRNGGAQKISLTEILDLEKLNAYMAYNNVLFVVKKHYYHLNEEEPSLLGLSNICDITNQDFDSQVLLKHADILVSDYSSAFIDYLLLDRPVIFYNYDFEDYLVNDRELYFPFHEVTPGPKVSTFHDFFDALINVVENKQDHFRSERKRVRDLFYSTSNQGLTGGKMLEYINRTILRTQTEENPEIRNKCTDSI